MTEVMRRSLLDLRHATFGWSVALALFMVTMIWVFPSVQRFPYVEELIRALPPAIQAMVGDPTTLSSVSGFLRVKLFENLPLLLGIFTIVHAADSIAGEEERGTLELLLAQPIERWQVVLGKFTALGLATVMLTSIGTGSLLLTARVANVSLESTWLVSGMLGAIPVALLFGSAALFGSCCMHRTRSAAWIGAALLAASYGLHLFAPLSAAVRTWAALSPVHTYLHALPLSGAPATLPMLRPLPVTLAFVALSLVVFQRRDISR